MTDKCLYTQDGSYKHEWRYRGRDAQDRMVFVCKNCGKKDAAASHQEKSGK